MLCEIGGTVGDIESLPFLEAIRQLGNELGRERALFVHLTLVPYIPSAGELKTKPTQHSVKELLGPRHPARHAAVPLRPADPGGRAQEDRAVLQRARGGGDPGARRRHDLRRADPVSRRGLRPRGAARISGSSAREPDLSAGTQIVERIRSPRARCRIAVVGKYTNLLDSYKSLAEALTHGGIANNVRVQLDWIDVRDLRGRSGAVRQLEACTRSWCPAASASAARKARSRAVRFARERKVPYFGICFGMQMAVIEAARNSAGIDGAELDRVRADAASRWSG